MIELSQTDAVAVDLSAGDTRQFTMPAAPAQHQVRFRLTFTFNGISRTRQLHVQIRDAEDSGTFVDFFQEVTNNSDNTYHIDIEPLIIAASTDVDIFVESDDAGDTLATINYSMFSDDVDFYLTFRAAEASPTADSLTERIKTTDDNVTTLIGRITAALFSGMTSLPNWLGAMAGKQAPDATAQTEIRARGAGSGTFDATTDSGEAIRDRGDAAWITATGFATAVALATHDTKLDGLITTVGVAGAGLTAINLPDQTMNITGNITGNLSGNVGGNVVGTVASVVGNIGGNLEGTLTATERNAIADAIFTRDMSSLNEAALAVENSHTLYTVIMATLESSLSGTTLRINQTDGSELHQNKTVTVDAAAIAVTGVSG